VTTENLAHRGSIDQIVKLIRAEKIDLTHTNNQVHRDSYAIEASKIAGVPVVSHLRTHHTAGFNQSKAKYVNQNTAKMIAYSESIKEHWENHGVETTKVAIVPNAIAPLVPEPANLSSLFDLPHDSPTIGLVGRVIPERGHVNLINAMPILLERLPAVKLLIVGDGDQEYVNSIKDRVLDLDLSSQVIFTGYYPNASEIIAAVDVMVLPYTIEPFGRTLLESWQLKTATVISNVGHINQIAEDGKHTLIVDHETPDALAAAIGELLTNSNLRETILSNAFQHCNETFSINAHARKIEQIYNEVLSKF